MYVKKEINIKLKLDEYFTKIKKLKGKFYFNVEFNDRLNSSDEYMNLKKLSKKGKFEVEPNGTKRASLIFTKMTI